MLQLIPVDIDYDIKKHTAEPLCSTLETTIIFMKKVHAFFPWIAYLAKQNDEFVGICAFKGIPHDNKVEIAYFTFPGHEHNGYGNEMCRSLIEIARGIHPSIIITAHTLREENASTRILRKNDFFFVGTAVDDEEGDVFEWHNEIKKQEMKI